jgi:hypothetical protein
MEIRYGKDAKQVFPFFFLSIVQAVVPATQDFDAVGKVRLFFVGRNWILLFSSSGFRHGRS